MAGDTGTLGTELRQLRGDISLRDLADRAGIGYGTIGRYETGRRRPTAEQLTKILDALGVVDPERERLLTMVRRDGPGEMIVGVPSAGRHLAYLIGLERAARMVTDVAPLVIPGLLQTADYARAVLGEGPDTDRRVRMRMERAEILTRTEEPVELRALIHFDVLTRLVAPPEVMSKQRAHLLRMSKRPNVTIQVMPTDLRGWNPSLTGPFILIEPNDDVTTPIVHVEHYRGGVFVWEHEDVRSFMAAADEMTRMAMTPARSAEVILELEQAQ